MSRIFLYSLEITCLLPLKTEQEKSDDIRNDIGEWQETFFINEHRYVSAPANIRYMGLILSPPIVKHFIDVKTSPKKSFI